MPDQLPVDSDLIGPFATWFNDKMTAYASAELPRSQIIERLSAALQQDHVKEVARAGLGPKVDNWFKSRGYVADHSRATSTGAPRVQVDQLTMPGIVEWIIVHQDQIEADQAAVDSVVTDWCKSNKVARSTVTRAVAKRRAQLEAEAKAADDKDKAVSND